MSQKNKKRRVDCRKIILGTVSVAGILAVGLVAPNALGAMAKLGLIPGNRQKEIIDTAQKRLIRQGLLVYKGGFVQLTPKGRTVLQELELKNYQIKKPRRWDKKWRVLIFDIPETRRHTRTLIRITLRQIGFVRLQDSVWVYPYDCEALIMLIKTDIGVGKDILYMVVEKLEGDIYLRSQFDLV